jgi:enoyl-CoA hydratase/carnithine racemase
MPVKMLNSVNPKSKSELFQVWIATLIKGGGGTQRLIRAIGKSKAMEMILTGRIIDAKEAESHGLVSKVLPVDQVENYAIKTAEEISNYSPIAIELAKDAINKALETPLSSGLDYERRLFHASFGTEDKMEGMKAFIEKRSPKFSGN